MIDDQQRIREDLVGELDGEVRSDDVTLGIYANDASLYRVRPAAVVFPAGHEDVVRVARYAAEHAIPLTARGAGTGTAGGCLGPGIVVDFSKSMRRVISLDGDVVRVEAGVVRDELNRQLRDRGLYFAPDPATAAVTTVGGMVAVNAGGSHSVRVGQTRDHVRRVRAVTAEGASFWGGREATGRHFDTTGEDARDGEVEKLRIVDRLDRLGRRHAGLIRERQGGVRPESSGYFLRPLADETPGRPVDLASLLVGSEGSLAVTTEAELHLTTLSPARGALMALFGHLEDATRVVLRVAEEQPAACDLLDRRLLTLARESDPRLAQAIPRTAEAALLLDVYGLHDAEVARRLDRLTAVLRAVCPDVAIARRADDALQAESLWRLPQRVVPLLARLPGAQRPLPFVEDVVVPPERWDEFLPRAQRVFQRHQVTSSLYAHAIAGQLHFRPFLTAPRTPNDLDHIESIARDLYAAVFDCGGTISGERGDGLSRTAFLRSRYGPLYRAFREVKEVFDPRGILNPGTIVSDDQRLTVRHIPRPTGGVEVPLQLRWPGDSLATEVASCNACGDCRRQDDGTRMCPIFRRDNSERAAPRSKADVWRSLLDGQVGPETLQSAELRELTQLCFNCKQCVLDCPSHVDIPSLVIEAKAAHAAAHGLKRGQWLLARAHSFGEVGCSISPLANWALGNSSARWMMEKTVGIDRRRRLPKFANRPFLRTARTSALRAEPQRGEAVLFVDHFANYHDTSLAAATVAVLRHNGFTVHLPPDQVACGMAMISAGDLEAARDLARTNVRSLAPLADRGLKVVCPEPAAALCLRDEYPKVLDDPDVALVSGATVELGRFLLDAHREGRLRTDFPALDLSLAIHTPCHLKAIDEERPFDALLRLIPGVEVRTLDRGCSGMAGTYGLTREHFDDSVAIGADLIEAVREAPETAGCTECSSCRIQMAQGVRKPTVHPVKVLAAAYGLMPLLKRTLRPSGKRLTID